MNGKEVNKVIGFVFDNLSLKQQKSANFRVILTTVNGSQKEQAQQLKTKLKFDLKIADEIKCFIKII